MTERNPTLAVFSLVIGCFVTAVALLVARSVVASLMFAALGALAMAAFYALTDRMSQVRVVPRTLVIVLALVVVPLAIGVIVAEFR